VKPLFSFVAVRGCVAALLILLGLMVHVALRRVRWYRGAPRPLAAGA